MPPRPSDLVTRYFPDRICPIGIFVFVANAIPRPPKIVCDAPPVHNAWPAHVRVRRPFHERKRLIALRLCDRSSALIDAWLRSLAMPAARGVREAPERGLRAGS